MTKIFEDELVLKEDKTFEESIHVKGSIRCKDGENFNLTVKGNIDAWDIDVGSIDAYDIDVASIDAHDIDAKNIDAYDISFYWYCISRKSLKCVSIEGRRENSLYECLDQDVEFKEDSEDICECCGQKIKEVEADNQ